MAGTTIKCPLCGRRQDVVPGEGGVFAMPEHQNYTKTAMCPASGRRYAFREDGGATSASAPEYPVGFGAASLLALAAFGPALERRRMRESRYGGRR
jgi:hypothetical protein